MHAFADLLVERPSHPGAAVEHRRWLRLRTLLLSLGLSAGAAHATAAVEIYRCPGSPAVYTSDLRLVRSGRCTKLGEAPAALRKAASVAPVSVGPAAKTSPPAPSPGTTIARPLQQQRDSDRVQILQAELSRERERLAQLTQQLRTLQSTPSNPDVAKRSETLELSQAIQRTETDMQALNNELTRALR